MSNKLLVICGPTATGKTKLGLRLAKKFNGEIISADSRQVFKDMDIGTGKEWPPAHRSSGSERDEVLKIWGYDLVSPKDEFSVSQFLRFAVGKIADIKKRGKLPVIVGGTGLYIKAIVDGIPTVDVPKNDKLRNNLESLSADQLYENLSQIDSIRAGGMNVSDRKNPRRLIRAMEVAQYLIDHKLHVDKNSPTEKFDSLFIGLTSSDKSLEERISKRVEDRVKKGFEKEVNKLIDSGVDWDSQAMMSLGYRQWRDFYEKAVDKETAISEWKKEERKYAKRQMTWFKRDNRIKWFDVVSTNLEERVEKVVSKWYSSDDA